MSFSDLTSPSDVSSMSEKQLEKLVEQLQDAISNVNEELNITKEEREAVDKTVKRGTEDLNRRMVMATQTGGVGEALLELETSRLRRAELVQQLDWINRSQGKASKKKRKDVDKIDKVLESLAEKEKSLNLQCLAMRKSLAETQSRCLEENQSLQVSQASGWVKLEKLEESTKPGPRRGLQPQGQTADNKPTRHRRPK
ncbi:capping protein inhibiting regulator of actin dynamics-like [Salvelinus namaycush]|uniref:Capping protein inhibiting regulator of actin dynamics-like n=1 Tax=Salvelinus namaycush TaxID=8040 RepID=A0A8U1F5T2_SALNM|nr:capping protein inhibiting regulator of actin dynamics-like [Salvelinus namaycush]